MRRGLLTDVAARLERIDPQRDLERARRLGIRWVVPGDPEWPPTRRPRQLRAAPGDGRRAARPVGARPAPPGRAADPVAIVGSRSATTYGTDQAAELAAGLARAGAAVVSGAAFGIDQAAHRGALAGDGPTVAVLACGVDRAYPAAHRQLLDHLAGHGADRLRAGAGMRAHADPLPVPQPAHRGARPRHRRGRGRARSGSLNTASWAARLHRPSWASLGR